MTEVPREKPPVLHSIPPELREQRKIPYGRRSASNPDDRGGEEQRSGSGRRINDDLPERFADMAGRFDMLMTVLKWAGGIISAIVTGAVAIGVRYFT